MSSIFRQVFACCLRNRSPSPSGSLDEHSRLIPATNDAPTSIPDVIVIDHQQLKERLGTIVRAKEGKMVNVNAQIPFNLHNQALAPHLEHNPSSSRSASASASVPRPSSRPASPQPSTRSASSAYADPPDGLLRNPTLNVRLVRGVVRGRRGRARGPVRCWADAGGLGDEVGTGDMDNGDLGAPDAVDGREGGAAEVEYQEHGGSRSPGENRGNGGTNNSEPPSTPSSDFKIQDAGDISRSWGD